MATDRKHALVRAAEARARIETMLSQVSGYLTKGQLYPAVKDLEYGMPAFTTVLDTMATNGLIKKVAIEHPDYKWGYMSADEPAPEKKQRAKPVKTSTPDIPIDIQPNRDGSVTIRVNGLALTVRKES